METKKNLYRVPGHGTRQRRCLPSAKNKALGKEGFEFFFKKFPLCRVPSQGTQQRHLKKIFAECRARGTRQSIFQKKNLPSARSGTLGKEFFFKKNLLCRVPNSRHSAKKDVAEHRYAGQPMPSAALLPRDWHSAKKSFAE